MPHAAVSPRQRHLAKQLRRTMTRAETLLWRYLKAHRIDELGFRRQVSIGKYLADFVCHSAKLVVEVDGESHDFESRFLHDRERDNWFKSQGYIVLRFTNEDVLSNLSGVVEMIRGATPASAHCAPPSLSLPHKGGGNPRTPAKRVRAARIAQSLREGQP